MTRSVAPSPTGVRSRPPVAVVVTVAITALRMAVGAFGLVYFGLFVSADVNPDVGSPGAAAFAAVGLALVVTALASLVGLWRGRPAAWHMLTCVLTAQIFFNCYKILVEGEIESVVLLVVDVVVAGLLFLPATRRHVLV